MPPKEGKRGKDSDFVERSMLAACYCIIIILICLCHPSASMRTQGMEARHGATHLESQHLRDSAEGWWTQSQPGLYSSTGQPRMPNEILSLRYKTHYIHIHVGNCERKFAIKVILKRKTKRKALTGTSLSSFLGSWARGKEARSDLSGSPLHGVWDSKREARGRSVNII